MSRPILTLLFALSLGCVSTNALNRRDSNQNATYLLITPAGGQCSGVVLTRDGYILTAGHCVRRQTETLMVYLHDGNTNLEARVVATDTEHDLALLKVNGHTFGNTAKFHSGRQLKAGDTVYHSGFPFGGRRGLPQLFGVGHIMNPDATWRGAPQHYIFIDLETGRPGASGSGVYDAETGGLIGMVDALTVLSSRSFDRMTIVLLVPIGDIRAFLQSNGLNIESVGVTAPSRSSLPPEVRVMNDRENEARPARD